MGSHTRGRKQMRLFKKEGGLNWWDLDAKVRALKATWILKFLKGDLSPAFAALLQQEIETFAEEGNLCHLLNDPDDNRASICSAPLADIIYSWSMIVRPAPPVVEGQLYGEIVHKVLDKQGKKVAECLGHVFIIHGFNEEGTPLGYKQGVHKSKIYKLDPLKVVHVVKVKSL